MGIVIRQSGLSTVLSFLGVVIGYVNIVVLFPAYLAPDELGLTRVIQDAAMLAVPFAQIGISQMVVRFFPAYRQQQAYGGFVRLILLFTLGALGLFTALFFLLQDRLAAYLAVNRPEINDWLGYILLLTLILAVYQVLIGFAQSLRNIVLPGFLKEVLLRLFTLLDIVLYATGRIDFTLFIQLLVGAYALNLLILAGYLFRQGALQWGSASIPAGQIRSMLGYGLFTFLGAGSMLIIGKIDSLMIADMLGLSYTAIYTTAYYIAVLIDLPKRAVAQISMPLISTSFENNKPAEIAAIYRKSALNNLIIGGLILISLWANLNNIFALIPRNEIYSLGRMVVVVIGLGKLLDMAAGVNGEILVMSRYYRVNVYLLILLAIITIIANYLLIPRFGIVGAAWGSTLALFLFNFSKYLFLYFKMGLQPFTVRTVKVLAVIALALGAGLLLPQAPSVWVDIFYRSAVITLFYGGLIYGFRLSPEINDTIISLFRQRR